MKMRMINAINLKVGDRIYILVDSRAELIRVSEVEILGPHVRIIYNSYIQNKISKTVKVFHKDENVRVLQ